MESRRTSRRWIGNLALTIGSAVSGAIEVQAVCCSEFARLFALAVASSAVFCSREGC